MTFSGALTLTDLNDFITPSQACIKPVEQTVPKDTPRSGGAKTEIRIDSNGSYYELANDDLVDAQPSEQKLEKAQISLNDCLACSGCITSAESVLITIQSHTEVLNFLQSNSYIQPLEHRKKTIVSIAPQSLASFAATFNATISPTSVVTPRQILRRLRKFCEDELGFDYVFDTTLARHLALDEHIQEFLERREKHRQRDEKTDPSQLPMIASACPGWICYAEKTHHAILPFIATTKSPQQVMGTLVKNWMGLKWGKLPSDIYHVTVMPCYDKKLEASRSDFYNDIYATRDVDCVITTGELELLMKEKGFDLSRPVPGEHDALSPHDEITDASLPELLSHPGSSSGSYLHSVINYLQRTSDVPLELSVRQVRNADYEEFTLRKVAAESGQEGETVFKGAKCYGFQNLQNVVRKVGRETGVRTMTGAAGRLAGRGGLAARKGKKAGASDRGYDYVEVMACPGGCVNGGGQLKPPPTVASTNADAEGFSRDWADTGVTFGSAVGPGDSQAEPMQPKWGDKEWTRKVEEAYWLEGNRVPDQAKPEHAAILADMLVKSIISELCLSDEGLGDIDDLEEQMDACRRKMFRTEYRAVEGEVNGLAVKW